MKKSKFFSEMMVIILFIAGFWFTMPLCYLVLKEIEGVTSIKEALQFWWFIIVDSWKNMIDVIKTNK